MEVASENFLFKVSPNIRITLRPQSSTDHNTKYSDLTQSAVNAGELSY